MANNVLLYTTAYCTYCDRAKALLDRKGVSFDEVRVDEDPAQRDIMLQRSNGQRTVPQIFIGDHHVGGSDDLYALDRAGELDRLLGIA